MPSEKGTFSAVNGPSKGHNKKDKIELKPCMTITLLVKAYVNILFMFVY